ncbi:MAG: type IV pili methyl-accepting chemotaxis transducer N-terminal domain-containing protein, partial [Rhodoferax sp.]|nr:type IV pili methyl-accepting chemotaxis transducer N-terminal domain-containing protein [Rhodoferax sp.]
MASQRHWNLGAKLALVAVPFMLLAVMTIGVTLWVSWQLEGGAAAVNEAGRMRMQAYRMSLSISTGQPQRLRLQEADFARNLETLR